MDQSIEDTFLSFLYYVEMKKDEIKLFIGRPGQDIAKIQQLRKMFKEIKNYMDLLLEDMEDGEEVKDSFRQQPLKDPQDKDTDQLNLDNIKELLLEFQGKIGQLTDAGPDGDSKPDNVKSMLTSINNNINQQISKLNIKNEETLNHSEQKNVKKLYSSQNDNKNKVFKERIGKYKHENDKEQAVQVILSQSKSTTKEGFKKNLIMQQPAQIIRKEEQKTQNIKVVKNNQIETPNYIQEIQEKDQQQQSKNIHQEEIKQQNVDTSLNTMQSSKQIMKQIKQIEMCNQIEHNGRQLNVIIMCQDGCIVTGGDDMKLYKYDQQGLLITTQHINDIIRSGIAIGQYLYCGIWNELRILDQQSLNKVTAIKIKDNANKLLLIENLLFAGQRCGYLNIIDIQSNQNVLSTQLNHLHIKDICYLSDNEYAFACNKGLYIYKLHIHNNTYSFIQNKKQSYFENEQVQCVQQANINILIVAIYCKEELFVIDRQQQVITTTIKGFDSFYNWNQIDKIIGYDGQLFPYFIVKDTTHITIINTSTYQVIQKCLCDYYGGFKHSLIQKIEDNKININIKIFTLNMSGIVKYRIVLKDISPNLQ